MAQTEVATSEEPAAPKAEELPRVEITGSAGRTTYSKTGTKIDTETRDVPASVQVISSQISQSFGTSFGGHILQDGYARSGGSFDWSSVAQMEALKEPASVPYGNQYNIGGQVNILSKIPTTKPTSVLLLGEAKDRKYRADPGLSAPSDTIWLSREAWSP